MVKNRDIWFLLLFASVLLVNIGYLSLSLSDSLEEALLANRISYFGSVFLPISMLMSILNVTRIGYKRWIPLVLLAVGIVVLLIAASPGYLNIYYEQVTYEKVDGIAVLNKVYGKWHCVYLFYLLGYFAAMIAIIWYAIAKKKVPSAARAIILAIAVLVNLSVWLAEQFVDTNFEFLSVSYIISELFLLGVHFIVQENERLLQARGGAAPALAGTPPGRRGKARRKPKPPWPNPPVRPGSLPRWASGTARS